MVCSVLSISLFVLALMKWLPLLLFYLFIFLLNCFMLLSGSAFNSQLPLVLEKKQLKQGNYRLSLSDSLLSMLAPSVAGILLGIVIAPIIFLIDALTFA